MSKLELTSRSVDDTLAFGSSIGEKLRGGEVFELSSDLGGGKTSFVRGINQGFGSMDVVSSPSFTICNTYKRDDGIQLNHFDFYRLSEPGIVKNELDEFLHDPRSIVVIEWGEIVDDVLPADRVVVTISTSADDSRTILFEYADSLGYLFTNLIQDEA